MIGGAVPSATVFDQRVWSWRLIQIGMGVIGVPGDEAMLDPPDQGALAHS